MQDCYLAYVLTELAKSTCMIFTRTCDNTRKIALALRNLGFGAIPIHGQMSQPKRLGALNKFKVGAGSSCVPCDSLKEVITVWALLGGCRSLHRHPHASCTNTALLCMLATPARHCKTSQ